MINSSPLYSPGTVMKDSSFLSASEKTSADQPAHLSSVRPETQRQVKHSPQPPRAHG